MSDRRHFLRGLASLPLIGGGLTLIGTPTAAAVPVTDALMVRYISFLAYEHREALFELQVTRYPKDYANGLFRRGTVPMEWQPEYADAERLTQEIAPSKRAAVILSAAGLPIGSTVA